MSPDMNIIESIYRIQTRYAKVRPRYVQQLWWDVNNGWQAVTQAHIRQLVQSYQPRIDIVIHADGGPVPYWFDEWKMIIVILLTLDAIDSSLIIILKLVLWFDA